MLEDLKAELLTAINTTNDDGKYSDEVFDRIQKSVHALKEYTPLPRPFDDQEFVAGRWGTLYAQFGPRHTAGKSIAHDNMFNFVSFAAFPKLPFRNLDLNQEIHHDTKDYNNVHVIEPIGGGMQCHYIVYGRYALIEDEPQRYQVDFYRAVLKGQNSESDADIRAAFGFDADQPLDLPLKSPKLHSDVVYCDDDIRINLGSVGGVYVLNRIDRNCVSVDFD